MTSPGRRKNSSLSPGVAAAIVLVGAVVIAVLVMTFGGLLDADEAASSSPAAVADGAGRPQPDAAPAPPGQTPIAVVKRRTQLRASPDGRRIATVGPRTEFKSARVLAVVGERPGWLRVMDAELRNGQTGWIAVRDTERGVVNYKLRVDLSARRLTILRNDKPVRRIRTAVGEAGTPTPTGRYAITDKVPFKTPGAYGCCALALTAHQPNTPSTWSGGDRIAIHATPTQSSIGQSVTLGCMRIPTKDARWLMRKIPLGSQVTIRA
jgi:lipoprotein-anchoring transpeptidase ErfK/SrfK